jgi:hypothetical protein
MSEDTPKPGAASQRKSKVPTLSPRKALASSDAPSITSISASLSSLCSEIDLPLIPPASLEFHTAISSGAFGTVGTGTLTNADGTKTPVAIKVIAADTDDKVTAFLDEARASYQAGGADQAKDDDDEPDAEEEQPSNICQTLGVTFTSKDGRGARLHLVMERCVN